METQEPVEVPTVEVIETYTVDEPLEVDEEIDPILVALRKERETKGWTQWDVARRMGYSAPTYISNLERGQHDLTLSTLRSWATVLGMEVLIRAPRSNRGKPRTNFR